MRVIKNPYYTNNARTTMSCEFHYDDGRVLTANISNTDGKNPDWIEIHATFSKDEIEKNTQGAIKKINGQKEQEVRKAQAQVDRVKHEKLYEMKLEAFEVPVIKQSTNKRLKAQIRKSRSAFEVTAYSAAVILDEYNRNSQANEEVSEAV